MSASTIFYWVYIISYAFFYPLVWKEIGYCRHIIDYIFLRLIN